MTSQGNIPHFKIGGRIIFNEEDVMAWKELENGVEDFELENDEIGPEDMYNVRKKYKILKEKLKDRPDIKAEDILMDIGPRNEKFKKILKTIEVNKDNPGAEITRQTFLEHVEKGDELLIEKRGELEVSKTQIIHDGAITAHGIQCIFREIFEEKFKMPHDAF